MKRIVPLLFSLALLFTFPFTTSASTTIDDIKTLIELNYVGEIDGDLENASTIEEVIELLDPYSTYFTAEEYKAFMSAIDMTTVGIGVGIEQHEKGILITNVFEGGSAYDVGIVPGDIITAVDGQSIVGWTVEQAQSVIIGKEQTEVSIQLVKENGTIVEKTLIRKAFSVPNVTSKLLYGNVGYIKMTSFSQDATTLVKKTYDQLLEQGATSFILDLQNNGGGFVSAAEQLIGLFPSATNAYKIKFSETNTSKMVKSFPFYYRLQDDGTLMVKSIAQLNKFPQNTRVLVNRYSASASEMTAAAIIDQHAGTLYGEHTYEKGTMQSLYPLNDGSYLKLTIGEFFGPNGTVVKDVGLSPHVQTSENPLFQAHFDSIADQLVTYKSFPMLKNVRTTKTFTVTFNQPLHEHVDSSSVALIQLGGQELETTLEITDEKIKITPTTPLQKGGHYLLIVNPTIQGMYGNYLKNGSYLYITVEE